MKKNTNLRVFLKKIGFNFINNEFIKQYREHSLIFLGCGSSFLVPHKLKYIIIKNNCMEIEDKYIFSIENRNLGIDHETIKNDLSVIKQEIIALGCKRVYKDGLFTFSIPYIFNERIGYSWNRFVEISPNEIVKTTDEFFSRKNNVFKINVLSFSGEKGIEIKIDNLKTDVHKIFTIPFLDTKCSYSSGNLLSSFIGEFINEYYHSNSSVIPTIFDDLIQEMVDLFKEIRFNYIYKGYSYNNGYYSKKNNLLDIEITDISIEKCEEKEKQIMQMIQ